MVIEHEEQFRMSIRTMTREVKYLVNIELSLRLCLLRGGKALKSEASINVFFPLPLVVFVVIRVTFVSN